MRRAVIQVVLGNTASKALGLGREVLTAALFGTGQIIGAYRIAQTGTIVPVNFFTSETLNAAFIPQYSRLRAVSVDKAQTLFWCLLPAFAGLATAIALALWLLASLWVGIVAPGLPHAAASLAARMLRVTALGVPGYLLAVLVMFLSAANHDFAPLALRPIAQNCGVISGTAVAFLLHSPIFIAWGFSGGYLAFAVWAATRAWNAGHMAFPKFWSRPAVGEVLRAFWLTLRPLLLLPVMLQGYIVVERAVASMISVSAISGLDYARFVTETVTLVISMPIAITGLAEWASLGRKAMQNQLQRILLPMLVIAGPICAFLAIHAGSLVSVLYARGAFNAESIRVTAAILRGIAFGLWAQVLGYVLIKALNAQTRNRAAVTIMALALLGNVAFDLLLYRYLNAITLGLGNTLYGIILLIGTTTALGLWRSLLRCLRPIAAGLGGYFLLSLLLPRIRQPVAELAEAVAFTVAYWLAWVALVPSLRRGIFPLLTRGAPR